MKPLFDIQSQRTTTDPYILLAEIGPQHCCVGQYNKGNGSIDTVQYYSFDFTATEASVINIFKGFDKTNVGKVVISSAFSEAVLMPQKFSASASSFIKLLFPGITTDVLQDRISEWQMVTAYAIPDYINKTVTTQLHAPEIYHSYTALIRQRYQFEGQQLYVNFHRSTFSVLLKLNGMIQLVQTYRYVTPLDVVYYLLKISIEFGVSQSELKVVLSGLIERDSSLYQELHQYFLQIHFMPVPELTLPEGDHPPYYFNSLYNLAACV